MRPHLQRELTTSVPLSQNSRGQQETGSGRLDLLSSKSVLELGKMHTHTALGSGSTNDGKLQYLITQVGFSFHELFQTLLHWQHFCSMFVNSIFDLKRKSLPHTTHTHAHTHIFQKFMTKGIFSIGKSQKPVEHKLYLSFYIYLVSVLVEGYLPTIL